MPLRPFGVKEHRVHRKTLSKNFLPRVRKQYFCLILVGYFIALCVDLLWKKEEAALPAILNTSNMPTKSGEIGHDEGYMT